MHPLAYTC